MLKVGLTGNFGMGKSSVGEVLRSLGAHVIDTDAIVKELFEDKKIQQALIELFGRVVAPSGVIDKSIISQMAFSNRKIRARLEDLLHPYVFKRIDSEIEAHQDLDMIIIEAPLIYERGYEGRFDVIINVYCPEDEAIERLKKKGYTEEQARARLAVQMPAKQKSALADFVVDNGGDRGTLLEQVQKIYKTLERMADDSNKRPS